jgi:pyrroline-5-carboxylate reductase
MRYQIAMFLHPMNFDHFEHECLNPTTQPQATPVKFGSTPLSPRSLQLQTPDLFQLRLLRVTKPSGYTAGYNGHRKLNHPPDGVDSHDCRLRYATILNVPQAELTIAVGNMGTAILAGVLGACRKERLAGAEPRIGRFFACVNSDASVERLKNRFNADLDHLGVVQKQNTMATYQADIVLLACKPYMIDAVLGEEGMAEALRGKLVISVIVGTPPAKLYAAIGCSPIFCFIVRAMLNIAAELGESMTVIETTELPGDFWEITNWIFLQLGKTTAVAPDLYDIGGVLAGMSGVLLSVALDGILDAAISQGIKRPEARKIMAQSLIGLARQLEQGHTPDQLREKTSSPRGTTIEGLMSLEEDRVRYAYTKAVVKATKRSQDIAIPLPK